MKSLILTWEGFQDQEVIYPYYRLLEEKGQSGWSKIAANVTGRIYGILGSHVPAEVTVDEVCLENKEYYLESVDLLVLPGGVKALEKLRQESHAVQFIKDFCDTGKVIASTCHGAQLMISAKITSGKKISGYYSIQDDIENSGAVYSRDPVVVSGNIVSSPHYDHMGDWMKTAIKLACQ